MPEIALVPQRLGRREEGRIDGRRTEPDLMVLRTRDQTVVLLRRALLANQADWNDAGRIVRT